LPFCDVNKSSNCHELASLSKREYVWEEGILGKKQGRKARWEEEKDGKNPFSFCGEGSPLLYLEQVPSLNTPFIFCGSNESCICGYQCFLAFCCQSMEALHVILLFHSCHSASIFVIFQIIFHRFVIFSNLYVQVTRNISKWRNITHKIMTRILAERASSHILDLYSF